MSARNILMAAAGSDRLPAPKVTDVFSSYTYTGNGSTRSINNGIDLAGKGGLVWIKSRTTTNGHSLYDTVRGANNRLATNVTNAQANTGIPPAGNLPYFYSTGFEVGSDGDTNASGTSFVSWTFRKAPKFFDVVAYSGDDANNRAIAHSLGVTPGMVLIKNTGSINSNNDDWNVWHRSTGQNKWLTLNSINNAQDTFNNYFWGASAPTASNFYLGANAVNLGSPAQYYVAYLFAHDPSADGNVQCGSFTADGSGNATVNHGWSKGVQFALLKASSTTGDWEMFDAARTSGWTGDDARLRPNLSNAEDLVSRLSASGSNVSFTGLTAGATYIYMFIVNP